MSRLTLELRSLILENYPLADGSPSHPGADDAAGEVTASGWSAMRRLVSYVEYKYGVARPEDELAGLADGI